MALDLTLNHERQSANRRFFGASSAAIAFFEVALIEIPDDELVKTKGNDPNPTRQRGILGTSRETQNSSPHLRVGLGLWKTRNVKTRVLRLTIATN